MRSWEKVFAIIWTGQLFSTLSSSVVGYAVIFWLSVKTGSAEVLAYATIAALAPQMGLGLFTGVFIDRWDRKKIMIYSDLFIAVCSAILCVLFYLGEVEVIYVYILLALRSVGSAFHLPAMQASVPPLAPESQLMRISGVNQIIQSTSVIVGPALAALFITALDMVHVLLFDIVGATIAIISLLMVFIPNPEKSENRQKPDVVKEIKEGLNEIFSKAGLSWMFIFLVAATFFIMPVSALFPLMTLNHFSGDTYQMSLVEIAWGVGMLLGGAAMGFLKVNKITLVNLMYLLLGLTFAFSGALPASGFIVFVGITTIGGVSGAIYNGAFIVVVQTLINPAVLGRVFSIYGSITLIPSMFGLLATGFIADSIGITNAFIIAGLAIMAIGAASFLTPSIARMTRPEETVGEAG